MTHEFFSEVLLMLFSHFFSFSSHRISLTACELDWRDTSPPHGQPASTQHHMNDWRRSSRTFSSCCWQIRLISMRNPPTLCVSLYKKATGRLQMNNEMEFSLIFRACTCWRHFHSTPTLVFFSLANQSWPPESLRRYLSWTFPPTHRQSSSSTRKLDAHNSSLAGLVRRCRCDTHFLSVLCHDVAYAQRPAGAESRAANDRMAAVVEQSIYDKSLVLREWA